MSTHVTILQTHNAMLNTKKLADPSLSLYVYIYLYKLKQVFVGAYAYNICMESTN